MHGKWIYLPSVLRDRKGRLGTTAAIWRGPAESRVFGLALTDIQIHWINCRRRSFHSAISRTASAGAGVGRPRRTARG